MKTELAQTDMNRVQRALDNGNQYELNRLYYLVYKLGTPADDAVTVIRRLTELIKDVKPCAKE